jgi:DNA-binding Xre family transcriptional regulator
MNLGARKMEKAIATRGSQQALADELGIHQSNVSRLATGKSTPGMWLRVLLKNRLKIPLDAWEREA